jgi:hypothetical protein
MKVVVNFIHGGDKTVEVSQEEFDNNMAPAFEKLYETSKWNEGCLMMADAMIPLREVKYIEFLEVEKTQ